MKKAEQGSIGERLRDLRAGMSQKEFAELLAIGRATLQRYEGNERNPDAELIIKLNVLFGADPLWLLTGKEPDTGGPALTAKEQQLLKGYRQLDNERRAAIDGMVQALVKQGK
ncbi:MAG TPA: helix-turn-helix transcriptional regulator [Gammaproteobacteria bacterium]